MSVASKHSSDIDRHGAEEGGPRVSAAKLHILQLEPIKARIGDRWDRLSHLVHRLFEKTLKSTQGPRDHFILVGELSYIVTFHDLTPEEAAIACAAVAQNVCELLFGNGGDGISVRSLVGSVSASALSPVLDLNRLTEILEATGKETLVSPNAAAMASDFAPPRVAGATKGAAWATGANLGVIPMWHLENGTSSSVFLSAKISAGDRRATSIRRALGGSSQQEILNGELALLYRAEKYALRFRASDHLGAIGVGVSYETLSGFQSRIRYITALKAISPGPFLIKIEDVPGGLPLSRLAEMVAMLRLRNIRILVEFAEGDAIPNMDVKVGATGIGTVIPDNCNAHTMQTIGKALAQQVARQRAFAFVNGLDSQGLLVAARQYVRFGFGIAVTGKLYQPERELDPALAPVIVSSSPHGQAS